MIIGHKKQWQFLKSCYEMQKLSHAYLFSGPEHIGKKTLAVEFVKFLNCEAEKPSLKPCQVCRSCKDIEKKAYPDFLLVEPEKEIKISQIRKMENVFSLYPSLSSFKIAIIDKAHSMTKEAQNSFLKTLEEPKGNTLFILISEYPEMLLPTILSRVQRINFHPAKQEEIGDYIKSKNISNEKFREVVELSLGRIGEIIDLIRNPHRLEEFKNRIREIDKLTKSDLSYRFQYVKDLTEKNNDLKEVLDIWLRYFRKKLLAAIKSQNIDSLTSIKITIENISKIQLLISTTNVNPRLSLETIMLDL
ncbi:DNA polymerase III subunit delta' [Candidatus Parcubacteria bacterium]|nr:DNA polymerase III subunit delta' [Candidatus Parcubacteria bacterium]